MFRQRVAQRLLPTLRSQASFTLPRRTIATQTPKLVEETMSKSAFLGSIAMFSGLAGAGAAFLTAPSS